MPIRVTCQCGRQLQLADENLGKKVRCPVCKHVFTAQPPADAIQEPDTFAFAPGEASSEDAPRRAAPPRLPQDDESFKPRRRRPASDRTPSGQWAVTRFFDPMAFLAIIGGALLLFFSFKEMRLSQASRDMPQTMTLENLIKNGPGDNAHVILTDFYPTDNWVFTYQTGKYEHVNEADAVNRRWSSVWVPLIPMNPQLRNQLDAEIVRNPNVPPAALKPSSVQVVVKLQHANDKTSVAGWCSNQARQPRLQGMVVNLTESLDSKTKDLFRQSYPGTDFSRCWIVHEGKTPTGPGMVIAGVAAGTLLMVLSGLWFVCRFLFRNG